ncbi:MAG: DUF6812 domain-containing protein [Solirubrobacterales bacterium]
MEMRVERIVLETEHHRITGDLHLPREGYRSRLSDYLNRGDDQFVPLSNAIVGPINGNGHSDDRDFLAVARAHVTLAYPAGEGDLA